MNVFNANLAPMLSDLDRLTSSAGKRSFCPTLRNTKRAAIELVDV